MGGMAARLARRAHQPKGRADVVGDCNVPVWRRAADAVGLVFGPLVAISALLIYGGYGLLFSSRIAGHLYERFARAIEFVFGAAFGALGGVLVLAGIRALRP